MQIKSKYDVGNINMFPIKQQQKPITSPACVVCNGEGFGSIEIDVPKYGKVQINCPVKRGDNNNHRPIIVEVNTDWVVLPPETIIHLSMVWEESRDRDFEPFSRNGVTYGLTPDKENSRRIWQEENLFSSKEDAQAVCDARNEQRRLAEVGNPTCRSIVKAGYGKESDLLDCKGEVDCMTHNSNFFESSIQVSE